MSLPFRKCSIKLSKDIFCLSQQDISVELLNRHERVFVICRTIRGVLCENEAYAQSKWSLGPRFFPLIRKITTSVFSTNRSCKSRWNANEMGFKPEEGSVKLEGPPAKLEDETDAKESEWARAVMNSSTFWQENSSRWTETSWENGNSHGITRFLNIPRRRLSELLLLTLPRSKSRFEYTNANIARRRIRIRHNSASES